MKQKRVVALSLFVILLSLSFVIADTTTDVENAYSCFEDLVDECETASTKEAAFALLAGAYDSGIKSDCKKSLEDKERNDCFGTTRTDDCDLKSTAIAMLALDYAGSNVDDYIDWLGSKKVLVDSFDWYLQVDAINATTCEIKANDRSERDFVMSESKRFSGSSSCLSSALGGYYLKIDEDCLEKNFTISCDQDFKTSVFYKRSGSPTMHISSNTHGAGADGETEERVISYCFSLDDDCEYEGSLWAALALELANEDTTDYIAYLSAMADDASSKKFLPSSFLYSIMRSPDYYSDLMQEQKQETYWEVNNNRFYGTALAVLGMDNSDSAREDAREYLIENKDTSGCWNSNSLLDTSFILFSAWPKEPSRGGGSSTLCTSNSFFCVPRTTCETGLEQGGFDCLSAGDECCTQDEKLQTCDEQNGNICEDDEICEGERLPHSGSGFCCQGSCNEQEENLCIKNDYLCRSSCDVDEKEMISFQDYCDFLDVCCAPKPKEDKGGANWMLIILLIILIILVILGIIFRNQLKIWYFRVKSKFKFGKGPKRTDRPSMPPGHAKGLMMGRSRTMLPRQAMQRKPQRRMPSRPVPGRQPGRPPAKGSTGPKKDKDFEETMKKLRDMAK